MNLSEFANTEFDLLKSQEDTPVVLEFREEIISLIEKFGQSGQSGGSAPFVAGAILSTIKNLLAFSPVTPIAGTSDEWVEVYDGVFQNSRCGGLFKEHGGEPYYLNAIVFQGEDEFDTFSGRVEEVTSRQFIKEFPFTPKTFKISVRRELFSLEKHGEDADVVSCGPGDMVYFIKDRAQLKTVFDYYLSPIPANAMDK